MKWGKQLSWISATIQNWCSLRLPFPRTFCTDPWHTSRNTPVSGIHPGDNTHTPYSLHSKATHTSACVSADNTPPDNCSLASDFFSSSGSIAEEGTGAGGSTDCGFSAGSSGVWAIGGGNDGAVCNTDRRRRNRNNSIGVGNTPGCNCRSARLGKSERNNCPPNTFSFEQLWNWALTKNNKPNWASCSTCSWASCGF